jgi:hypothetical protein
MNYNFMTERRCEWLALLTDFFVVFRNPFRQMTG